MSAVDVREVDLADEAALRVWWEVGHNADVNDHMNAVNERHGYTPVDRSRGLQKLLR